MKWSFPHFMHKGILCSMASFKEHCAFGFWKEKLVVEQPKNPKNAMGTFGRITFLKDLPDDKLFTSYIKKAAMLNDENVKIPARSASASKRKLFIPLYFSKALKQNTMTYNTFSKFSPTNKREYVEWVTEAKTNQTRLSRLETAIQWISEGKIRNWKYVKK